MPKSLLMSNQYFLCLKNKSKQLDKRTKLQNFLRLWPDFDKCVNEIFICILCKLNSNNDSNIIPSKAQRREIFKTTCAFKKIKFMNNPVIAKSSHITKIRDQ